MSSKPSTHHERIDRFVAIHRFDADHFPWRLGFYEDDRGSFGLLDGNVQVKAEGAIIRFAKVRRSRRDRKNDFDWDFHNLTLHPLGADSGPVDLQWMVTKNEIILHDAGIGAARTFSYTISIRLKDAIHGKKAAKLYFDPQLVNLGGSGEIER